MEKNKSNHDHDHGARLAVTMFFIGLAAFIIGLFVSNTNETFSSVLFIISVITAGYHIIFEGIGNTISKTKQAKKFQPNVHFLMTIATAGAIVIGNYEEAALLILIFAGAHFLEDYVDGKSKREITNLLNLNPTEARILLADGTSKVVSVDQVKVGDTLQVLNGAQVPTDGVIISGSTSIDESSINGESIPKEKNVGDEVFGSTINGSGTFTMEVTKDSTETVFAKILELVDQSQQSLTKTATLIQRLEPRYVTIALALYPFVLLAGPYLLGWSWDVSLYRSMVYLISVSPCALAASAVPTTLSTISNLSKKGVLVKGGAYLSKLNELKAISFDKTGTLTSGKPVVTDFSFASEENEDQLIDLIVAMESQSNHPLATAIINNFPDRQKLDITVENEVGRGLSTTYQEKKYRIGKPSSFEDVSSFYKDDEQKLASEGKTVVLIGKNEKVIGLIALMDVPNDYAKDAITYFNDQGIHTTMITGDAKLTGEAVGRQVGVAEVVANVMPENKASIVAEQQKKYGATGMLGDGINDAPALVTADVGIAMGDGTDVAMDVADLVLMKNDLSKLVYAHKLTKKMDKVTWQNICFSMLVVALLVTLNFLGKMNIAIGVIVHEGSTILVILNALRLLRTPKKYL
ncbi:MULTISPECIES: heavy metal translocating P-type ATPase [Vagococcus]|uniref:Lead, cadmium, zinc and mercury transporting ATPase Copper-translocating P-type ATPase n=1 Tax=Vagococcus fluvialis bH819 TaxID=1255619 RepID=A0A1X6WPR5_9ENTE|nr:MULTISPECIES: heavy metal translocating P-type ATPase [Vagococcus]SLM86304.1 Lead, cadmium, zinc and mercury transporting ATPase; Copper-translocating P-type ATPase [Vagococcus fluvialis bH819]HCM88871.1 heavy metal translocating P-type ATPase [Vagococcus sp.]